MKESKLAVEEAAQVRADVCAWFQREVRKNPDNLAGVIVWASTIARQAKRYIETGDVEDFFDMHLAVMSPIPTEINNVEVK